MHNDETASSADILCRWHPDQQGLVDSTGMDGQGPVREFAEVFPGRCRFETEAVPSYSSNKMAPMEYTSLAGPISSWRASACSGGM